MPQWRKFWTKSLDSFDLDAMPDDTCRLAWVLLPLALDREGRGVDNPAWLSAKLFPLRTDLHFDQIQGIMTWWAEHEMIHCYRANGRRYFCVPSWYDHQGRGILKEAESIIPPPPDWIPPDWHPAAAPGPDQDESDTGPSSEPVQTSSRPTPDLLQTSSGPAHDPDTDTETEEKQKRCRGDADADAGQGGRGPPVPAAAAPSSDSRSVKEVRQRLRVRGITDPALTELVGSTWVTVPLIDSWWSYIDTWPKLDRPAKVASLIHRLKARRVPPAQFWVDELRSQLAMLGDCDGPHQSQG